MNTETLQAEPCRALTVRQVAERVSVSRATVERWIRAGQLPSVELGGCRRVLLADLAGFLACRRQVGWRPLRDALALAPADAAPLPDYEAEMIDYFDPAGAPAGDPF